MNDYSNEIVSNYDGGDEDIFGKRKQLKSWIADENNKLPSTSDKLLDLFLHSCYYDLNRAKRSINCYYEARSNSPELFRDRNPHSHNIKTASDLYYCILLPGTTDEGYKVIMMGHRTKDVSRYNYQDVLKLFLMSIDMWLKQNQVCAGYLFAIDCKNTVFGHFSPIPFATLAKLCSYFQNSLPVRLQGLILINVSPAVNVLLKCLRILLTKKLANMIYQYTEGNEKLYERIPKKILPIDVDGDNGSITSSNDAAFKELCDHASWFRDEDDKKL